MQRHLPSVLVLCLLAHGCATPDAPLSAAIDLPAQWQESSTSNASPLAADWWQSFGSAELSTLIARALRHNNDLAVAAEQVRQAELQMRIAGASLYPAVDIEAASSHRHTRSDTGAAVSGDISSAGLSASYEIDLWGRIAAQVASGRAAFAASGYDRDALAISVTAGVADAYFQVLTVRERLAIARDNLAIAERVLDVVEARARHGSASQLDLTRQRATVLEQQAVLLPLQLLEQQTLAALAVLTGSVPQAFAITDTDLYRIGVPDVGVGLPADLLTRRPDIAAGEARLASAHADLAAARAALLPSIRLTGSGGMSSAALLSLADPTRSSAVTLSLLQNVFDAGRLRGDVELAASRERAVLEEYRRTVLAALAEVDTALSATVRNSARERLQERIRDEAAAALRLAELRYKEGSDDLLAVLDAQRSLFQAQDQRVQLRLLRLQSTLALFKALGGGWQQSGDRALAKPQSSSSAASQETAYDIRQ